MIQNSVTTLLSRVTIKIDPKLASGISISLLWTSNPAGSSLISDTVLAPHTTMDIWQLPAKILKQQCFMPVSLFHQHETDPLLILALITAFGEQNPTV